MNEVNQTYNLNSYYTSTPKIEKPKHVVAQAPDRIPEYQIFNDQKARKKLAIRKIFPATFLQLVSNTFNKTLLQVVSIIISLIEVSAARTSRSNNLLNMHDQVHQG